MAQPPYALGIDLSTTGAKALLIDASGDVVQQATTPLTRATPHPLWSEQNPEEWWQATVASIRSVLQQVPDAADAMAAIGLTGQMHGMVLLDADGQVLRPAILWNDQRTAAECDEIRAIVGRDRLIRITGNDAVTGLTAPKLLWVRHHEPDVWARARHLLLPKDYIRYRLTGDYAVDKADGSGTLLFDVRQRDWSPEITSALGIPMDWLPPTFEGTEQTGTVSPAAAHHTGLRAGVPVVAGGGDQSAQAVGTGAIEPGIVSITLGTSGVVFAATAAPLIEPEGRLHAFCHAWPGHWHLMGVMLSAAGSLQWFRDTLAPEVSFTDLLDEAATAPAGSSGLLFLPYLAGERTPHPDPLARGAWVGLTVRHQRAHLVRAVLEGVAFGLRDGVELLRNAGLAEVSEVRVSGGGAQSRLWRQILASVLGTRTVTVRNPEGAAYGAALLAGVRAGLWSSVPAACAHITTREPLEPDASEQVVYASLYATYRQLYPALRETFTAVAPFDQ